MIPRMKPHGRVGWLYLIRRCCLKLFVRKSCSSSQPETTAPERTRREPAISACWEEQSAPSNTWTLFFFCLFFLFVSFGNITFKIKAKNASPCLRSPLLILLVPDTFFFYFTLRRANRTRPYAACSIVMRLPSEEPYENSMRESRQLRNSSEPFGR